MAVQLRRWPPPLQSAQPLLNCSVFETSVVAGLHTCSIGAVLQSQQSSDCHLKSTQTRNSAQAQAASPRLILAVAHAVNIYQDACRQSLHPCMLLFTKRYGMH